MLPDVTAGEEEEKEEEEEEENENQDFRSAVISQRDMFACL